MAKLQHVLIIGLVWPEPTSSAAGTRMLQLLGLFNHFSWKVSFASAAQPSSYTTDLRSLNIDCHAIDLNSASFDAFLAELNPTVVIFDRFVIEEQFGWRVAEICPHSLRILDTEDLHCLRIARQSSVKRQSSFSTDNLLREPVASREIASILRCDLAMIISEYELGVLTEVFHVDRNLLFYLPLFSERLDRVPTFEKRADFLFIGNFLHEPNTDAAIFLNKQIWTAVRSKLPEAKMQIYGAYAPNKILQLHNEKNGFIVNGRAGDAGEVCQNAKVVLAPLRFGAGLKGKLLEAMRNGTPTVTTTVGAEGIAGASQWNGYITDNVSEFASKAIQLFSNKENWLQAQQNGYDIIHKRFNQSDFVEVLYNRLMTVQHNLESHRTQNFMGRMLMHHTLTSTKYMSKWIESKNKKNPA